MKFKRLGNNDYVRRRGKWYYLNGSYATRIKFQPKKKKQTPEVS